MRNGFLASLAALLLAAGLTQAQQWGPYPYPQTPYPSCTDPGDCMPTTPSTPELYDLVTHEREYTPRFWISGEYLYWWAKSAPAPGPLVTTGSAADAIPGAVGQPHTTVLLGNDNIGLPGMNGFRLTFGGWLDCDSKFGLEASGFILENGLVNYGNASGPVLAVPINVTGGLPAATPGQNAVPLNNPGLATNPLNAGSTNPGAVATTGPYTGSVNITLASQLWGGELNGYYNLFRKHCWSVDVLGGFRYLGLQETLSLNASSTDAGTLTTSVYNDNFQTSNEFFGGQVGLRTSAEYGHWSLMGSLKLALGVNDCAESVGGFTTQTALHGGSQNFAGGIFAQSTNIGSQRQEEFSMVPAFNFKVGYDLTPHLRFFAGYDFLYWTNVVRASNQIDHNINTSQAYGGTLVGPVNPAPMFGFSNYYAQGVSAGIIFRY